MLKIELLCNVKTQGVIYKAGVFELEKKVAQALITDGLARMALIEPVPEPEPVAGTQEAAETSDLEQEAEQDAAEPEEEKPETSEKAGKNQQQAKKGGAKK